MSETIVYSVDANNTYTLEPRYTATIGKVKWWTGPDVAGYTNIIPTGPQRYEDIGEVLATLKRSNTKPFLIVRFIDQAQKMKYRAFKQAIFSSQVTVDSTVFGMTVDSKTYTNNSQDVGIMGLNLLIQDSEKNNATEYIPCGDETNMVKTSLITSFFSLQYREDNSYLFAHKSIMQLFPRQDYVGNNSYMANVLSSKSGADLELYVNIGPFYNLAQNSPAIPYTELPAIMRCFVAFDSKFGYISGRSRGVFIQGAGKRAYTNTAGNNYYNATLCTSVDDAVANILGCTLNKNGENAITFQGLYVPEQKKIYSERALRLMNGFCNSDYNPIPKYVNACACLGRRGVEQALRQELNNDMVRMVCQSTACLDGDRTGDVFTFAPTPPCAPINICKPGLDINAARVTLSNVTFNCNFNSDAGPATSSVSTQAPNATPNAAPAPNNAPNAAPPAAASDAAPPSTTDAPPAAASDAAPPDSKTGTIIGASLGVVGLIVLVVVIVVIIKRKNKQK